MSGPLVVALTARGFAVAKFKDANGIPASIQDSSIATEPMLWIGCDSGEHIHGSCSARMHLTVDGAKAIRVLLDRFIETGTIAEPRP